MNKTKCIVVDDEPLAIDLLTAHIGKLDQLELVSSFDQPLRAFEYMKNHSVDLLFCDIQMPTLTGIDLLKSIKNPPKVILTTAYREYALDGFELNAVDYLLKPITFDRFLQAIDKYFDLTKASALPIPNTEKLVAQTESTGLFVRAEKKNVKVEFDQILYIESIKDYIKIHTQKQTITSKEKIGHFEQLLPNSFIRVHRSFIVNSSKITAYTNQDIEISEIEIPIGGLYKQQVLAFLNHSI